MRLRAQLIAKARSKNIKGPYNKGTAATWAARIHKRDKLVQEARRVHVYKAEELSSKALRKAVETHNRVGHFFKSRDVRADIRAGRQQYFHSVGILYTFYNNGGKDTVLIRWTDTSRRLNKANMMKAFWRFVSDNDDYNANDSEINFVSATDHTSTQADATIMLLDNIPHFNTEYHWYGLEEPSVVFKKNECAWGPAMADSGFTEKQIEAITGVSKKDGLTPNQLKLVYEAAGVTYYGVDLAYKLVVKNEETRVSTADHHQTVVVHIYTGTHVLIPDKAAACTIINTLKSNNSIIECGGERVRDTTKIEKTTIYQVFDTFEEAWDEALSKEYEQSYETDKTIKVSIAAQIKAAKLTRDNALAKPSEGLSNVERDNARRVYRTDCAIAVKKLKAEKATRLTASKAFKNRNVTINNIYVRCPNLYSDYLQLLERKKIYKSNMVGGLITSINVCKYVTVYANVEYNNCRIVASKLGVEDYQNQSIAGMGLSVFDEEDVWQASVFNNATRELVDNMHIAGHQWTEEGVEVAHTDNIVGVDHYRQYTSIANEGNFYRFNLCDSPVSFDITINGFNPGMYFVETDNMDLFKGPGLYDYKVVAFAVNKSIIEWSDITHFIKCEMLPGNDNVLQTFIKNMYQTLDDKSAKTVVNHLVGSFGCKHASSRHKNVVCTEANMANYYYNTGGNSDKSIHKLIGSGTDDTNGVWVVNTSSSQPRHTSDKLIRLAIVQRARMATYKTVQAVKALKNTTLLAINTDAVFYRVEAGGEQIQVPLKPTFGQLRRENVDNFMVRFSNNGVMKTINSLSPKAAVRPTEHCWKQNDIKVSDDEFFDHTKALEYNRLYIDGFAGAGKSRVALDMAATLRGRGLRVVTCAFTHVAALIIDGVTCHSLFGIDTSGDTTPTKMQQVINNYDAIIVDEASMLTQSILHCLTLLPPSMRIYILGDFRQHKPIGEGNNGELYRDTQVFMSIVNYECLTLRKQCRTDSVYANGCVKYSDAGSNETTELPKGVSVVAVSTLEDKVNISFTNKKRKAVNKALMLKIGGNKFRIGYRGRLYTGYKRNTRQKAIHTVERFDERKLAYIVQNPSLFKEALSKARQQFRNIDEDGKIVSENPLSVAGKYLVNSRNGVKEVMYKQSVEGVGRFIPSKSQSLATLARPIRHTIAGSIYHDIDMINAHPIILLQLCSRDNIATPELKLYCEDREVQMNKIIKDGFDRDAVKKLLLSSINGGRVDYKRYGPGTNKDLDAFYSEMTIIQDHFAAKPGFAKHCERRRANKRYNATDKGSWVNVHMLNVENAALMAIMKCLSDDGLLGPKNNECVLCSDGIMVLKELVTVDSSLIRKLEMAIRTDTTFTMQLKCKAMTEAIAMPEVIPEPLPFDDADLGKLDEDMYDEFTHIYEGMPVIATENRKLFKNNQQYSIDSLHEGGRLGLFDNHGKSVGAQSAEDLKQEKVDKEVQIAGIIKELRAEYCEKNNRKNVPRNISLEMRKKAKEIHVKRPHQYPTHNGAVVRLKNARNTLVIRMVDLKKYFVPAYCLTSHKIQGQTIVGHYTVHEWNRMDKHAKYVSLTRAQNGSDVTICHN